MRIETKSCSGILARPTTGRLRSTGKLSMRVSFTTAPGRDDFHSKSCLYKSRLLLPVNVCVFINVPTFDDHMLPRAAQHVVAGRQSSARLKNEPARARGVGVRRELFKNQISGGQDRPTTSNSRALGNQRAACHLWSYAGWACAGPEANRRNRNALSSYQGENAGTKS